MKKGKKSELETNELSDNVDKVAKLLNNKSISAEDMDFIATVAYELFLVSHWNIAHYIADDTEKEKFIYDLCNSLFKYLHQVEN